VFINYRGEDSYGYGAWLHAELSRRLGPELVFLDSESIPAGADFADQLLSRVRAARVLLAVIGTRWLTAAGADGRRRIDDPGDWIRRELEAAFAAGVRVIPVLTDDAQMPTEADLPADLAPLGRCQFRRLRHREAATDLGRLVAELAALDPDLDPAAQESSAGWPVPNQLPAAARYFTGRDEELTRLLRLPDSTAQTLVVSAVDGMAGIGKTALVVLAAHRLVEAGRYPDGTLFVDLHGYSGPTPTDPAAALESLLRGLGVPGPQIPSGLDARIGLYRSVLTRRRVLIVLDNVRAEAQVRPLLPGGGRSLVLITSRRRLSGLDEADHLNLDTLPAHEAGWLFRAVAGADRDPGDQEIIAEIVGLCGCLPLAVRIAAARLRTDRARTPLTGPQLLTTLRTEQQADRLNALAEGDRSVAAAFAVSYRHLPVEQQEAFAALGLHPGLDYEPYATAALLDTSPAHAERLLHGLEQFNLLDQPKPGRHRFHNLIRAYATTIAEARPEAGRRAALDRLFDHYACTSTRAVALAYPYDTDYLPRPPQAATPGPRLPDHTAAAAWLDTEQANLLAAAAYAASHRPEHTTHQSAILHRHLYLRGHYTDAHALHQHALTAVQATGDPAAHIIALNNLGWVHYEQGRYGPATDCLSRALQAARAADDRHGELSALNGLGRVHHAQGRYGSAAECYTRALEMGQATGNRNGELDALNGLGRVHYMQGRYGPAIDCHTQALQVARAAGHRVGELTALSGLGWVHFTQGRYGPAVDCHTRALEAARAIGDRIRAPIALTGLGDVYRAQGRYSPAADCYTLALEEARATGHRFGELAALTGLGWVHHAQGRYGPAADCFEQVLDLASENGDRNFQFEGHLGLGCTLHATGCPHQALTAHQQALALARDLGQPTDQARAYDGLAQAHHTLGHPDQARRHWQHALDILTALDTLAADELTTANLRARLADLETPHSPAPP
jgi:tetratricopeptide (TPR) repeat protein